MTVSPDGMWVATFSEDQTIILWSTKDGSAALELTPRAAIQGDTCSIINELGDYWLGRVLVGSLAFSSDSKHLGMYCKDRRSRRTGTLLVYDIPTGTLAATKTIVGPDDHPNQRYFARFSEWSPDGLGGSLALSTEDVHIGIVDTSLWREQADLQMQVLGSTTDRGGWLEVVSTPDVCFSENGARLLSQPYMVVAETEYRPCKIWDVKSSSTQRPALTLSDDIIHARFSPTNSNILVTVSKDGHVRTVDVEHAEVLACFGTLPVDPELSIQTLFFPDGTKVLSYVRSYYTSSRSHPAIVSVWNTTTGGHILSLEAHARDVSVVAISPDGEYIAIASSRPVNPRVWRARVGTCLGVFTEHSVEVTHLMFSRDGETLCSASKDGYVCIRRMREIVSRG